MITATRTPFSVLDLKLTPVTRANLPVAVAQATDVEQVKCELANSSGELVRQSAELAAVTKGTWESVSTSLLQKARSWINKGREASGYSDTKAFIDWASLGALTGLAVGVITGAAVHDAVLGTYVGVAFGGAVAAFCPAAMGVRKLGEMEEARARGRMVELRQVDGPLQRFRDASGASKVQVLGGLEKLYARLCDNKAASPEALAALKAAITDGEALRSVHGDRVRQFTTLGTYVHGQIDAAALLQIEAVLNELSAVERPVVAEAMRQLVFVDRKRVAVMPFDIRNELHELLTATPSDTGALSVMG